MSEERGAVLSAIPPCALRRCPPLRGVELLPALCGCALTSGTTARARGAAAVAPEGMYGMRGYRGRTARRSSYERAGCIGSHEPLE